MHYQAELAYQAGGIYRRCAMCNCAMCNCAMCIMDDTHNCTKNYKPEHTNEKPDLLYNIHI